MPVWNFLSWTGLEFGRSQRAAENRENWRKLDAKSSVVTQRLSRLRDRWRWCWWRYTNHRALTSEPNVNRIEAQWSLRPTIRHCRSLRTTVFDRISCYGSRPTLTSPSDSCQTQHTVRWWRRTTVPDGGSWRCLPVVVSNVLSLHFQPRYLRTESTTKSRTLHWKTKHTRARAHTHTPPPTTTIASYKGSVQ